MFEIVNHHSIVKLSYTGWYCKHRLQRALQFFILLPAQDQAMLVNSQERMICERRVRKEHSGIVETPMPNIHVAVDPTNLLNWYCMIYGLDDPQYRGGEYIFNIKLSPRYPFEPPDFFFLTPNGRFELNRKLCFSNSSYHKETWSPIWTVRTIILGFLSFFLENVSKGLGHMATTADVKREFAQGSIAFNEANLSEIVAMIRTQNNLLSPSASLP